MLAIKEIIINKNRGWRGLAELIIRDATHTEQFRMIFSFSQAVWDDMLNGQIVVPHEDYYYVLHYSNFKGLPRKDQQRSVLINHFTTTIDIAYRYNKLHWSNATAPDWTCISNFLRNKNNHTQSNWNCIRNTCYSKNIK